MSRKNNVNPDRYKIRGRGRPDEIISPPSHGPAFHGGNPGAKRTSSSPAALWEENMRHETGSVQTSNKMGVMSGSEKQDRTRQDIEAPDPASTPVAGAFGKTGSLSEVEEELIHPEEDADTGNDFLAERRRQNRRAKK